LNRKKFKEVGAYQHKGKKNCEGPLRGGEEKKIHTERRPSKTVLNTDWYHSEKGLRGKPGVFVQNPKKEGKRKGDEKNGVGKPVRWGYRRNSKT